jgi:bacterioferritin (cytochrome b1)
MCYKEGNMEKETTDRIKVLNKVISTKLALGQKPEDILKYIESSLKLLQTEGKYGDPFAEGIEEFMEKQAMEVEAPQEKLEEKLEDEGSENPGIKEESPQEKMENRLENEGVAKEETKELEAPQEQPVVESSLKDLHGRISKLAAALASKGRLVEAQRVLEAAGLDVVEMLQTLLKSEFRQRDLYEAYDWVLSGSVSISVKEHLLEHLEDEMTHASTLQRFLTGLGVNPTLERHPIPEVEPCTYTKILEKDLELEKEAVENYTKAIAKLEGLEEWTSLRVELENILIAEQEHVHDLERWIKGDKNNE